MTTDPKYLINTAIQFFLTDLEYSLDPTGPCEVTKIFVRPLRHKFIVTALLNGFNTVKTEIPREDVELFPPFAACTSVNCSCNGPLGAICDQPQCFDSGHKFAEEIPLIESVTLHRY